MVGFLITILVGVVMYMYRNPINKAIEKDSGSNFIICYLLINYIIGFYKISVEYGGSISSSGLFISKCCGPCKLLNKVLFVSFIEF